MMTVALILLSITPQPEPLQDRVDAFEVNRLYDESGRLVFIQLIGWDWHGDTNSQHVVFWRLVKSPAMQPIYDHSRREWCVYWLDGDAMREVRAISCEQTWTQHDPERCDLVVFPQERRRGLQTEPPSFCKAEETT